MRWGEGEAVQQDLERDHGSMVVLRTRARFHLLYRLAGRLLQVAAVEGGAHTSGRWQLLLVGFVALDIGLWALLREPTRFLLKTRMVLDAIDIATWSLAPYPNGIAYDAAVVVGFPLAMEAGFRLEWLGLVVPAFGLGVTALVRVVAGQPILPISFVWLVIAVASGVALRRHDGRLRNQVREEWERHRSAEEALAFVGGQNAVAMGANSTVDVLAGVLPVIGGRPARGSALWELADAWKARLGAATTSRAVYLGMAVQQWAAAHNQHPDLSTQVLVSVAIGDGTMLLTGTQATALDELLNGLDLRGAVPIRLGDHQAAGRPPGGPVRILVGSHSIDVPADPKRSPRICDPAPLAFVLGAILIARGVLSIGEQVPWLPTAASVVLALIAARWAHLRLLRLGTAARSEILLAVIGVGAIQIGLGSLTMKHFFDSAGGPLYPGFGSLIVLALVGGTYFPVVSRRDRWLVLAGAFLLVALNWFLHQAPEPLSGFLLTLPVPVALYLTGMRFGVELDRAEALYAAEFRAGDTQAMDEAFERGQESVVQLVRMALADARVQLSGRRTEMEPTVSAFADRRLEEVDQRLKTMTPAGE